MQRGDCRTEQKFPVFSRVFAPAARFVRMRLPKSGTLRYERASALILLVFSGGSILDALLRIAQLAGTDANPLLHALTAGVPLLIAIGVWTLLRKQKELSGTCFVAFMVAVLVGWISPYPSVPISWYLGIGLIMWSMRLGQSLLMWVGTSLLVLAAGAQFKLIDSSGALFLPFVITVPLFLGAAAYFQFNQVRTQADEIDLDAADSAQLHLKRYGRLPTE